MEDGYLVVYEGGTGEIIEKKSRFIANVWPAESEEEALAFIEKIKKKYWDARHNCYAYVIGEKQQLQRFSDDGEPSQTAGKPMLDVLAASGVRDAVVVVTRYFGGTLLGTGGLVRAYSAAAKAGLENSVVLKKQKGIVLKIHTDYNGLGKLQYLAGKENLEILDSEYGQQVLLSILVPANRLEAFKKAVTELTGGKAGMETKEEMCFAKNGRELVVF